jgi:hypothetical protein
MSMHLRSVTVVRAAAAALIAGLLLAGCAGDEAGDGEPTPSPSSPAAPSPSLPSPVLPTVPPTVPPESPPVPPISPPATGAPRELTITGELVSGVEAGCLLLATDTGEYLLFGEPVQQLQAGETVTLQGRVRTDMMSTCQQGTPFEVTEVLR